MARQTKPESKLTEAADKATAMLQGLQSRLHQVAPRDEAPDDLDRQLREYFVTESGNSSYSGGAVDAGALNKIQDRVIDAVANRILDSWERGDRREPGALENKVIDRLAQRILERMARR